MFRIITVKNDYILRDEDQISRWKPKWRQMTDLTTSRTRSSAYILVTSAEKDCVQGRSADLPGTARWCPSVPSAVYSSRQHPDPTKTSVVHLGRSVCSCCQTGRRAFSVAGARVWNDLPADVTSAPSLSTFRIRLKLHLFPFSYPGLVLQINFFSLRGPCGSCLLRRPP